MNLFRRLYQKYQQYKQKKALDARYRLAHHLSSSGILSPNETRRFLDIAPAAPLPANLNEIVGQLNSLATLCRVENDRWWKNPATGAPLARNHGELFMLMVTELAEGYEGIRKDMMDTHLPNRKMVDVELADCMIRMLDYCGEKGIDIGGAFVEKTLYNRSRADHTNAARLAPGGKKF